jgi:hypothetical protein
MHPAQRESCAWKAFCASLAHAPPRAGDLDAMPFVPAHLHEAATHARCSVAP